MNPPPAEPLDDNARLSPFITNPYLWGAQWGEAPISSKQGRGEDAVAGSPSPGSYDLEMYFVQQQHDQKPQPSPAPITSPSSSASAPKKNPYRPPKVSRRKKKQKRGGPRRSLTAYNLFFRDIRRELVARSSTTPSFEQMGKIVGAKWKVLAEEERAKYAELARQDSLRYKHELKIFEENRKKELEQRRVVESTSLLSTTTSALRTKAGVQALLPEHCRLQSLPSEWMERNLQQSGGGSPFPIAPGTVVSVTQPNGMEQKYKIEYNFVTMKQHEARKFMADLRNQELTSSASLLK